MFREFLGLPLHALVVHAAVTLIPLLAVLAAVYVLRPTWRPKLDWAVALSALGAPVVAFVSTQSGEALQTALIDKGYQQEALDGIYHHSLQGDMLFRFTVALSLVTLALLVVNSRSRKVAKLPSWVGRVLSVLVVVLSIPVLIYTVRAGHTGAETLWQDTF
ncbi:hypothetical protein E1091_10470 [Micromonospora fluostatini]|uniref:DUF2231 domain-containing protein n=1 Tax=Micromonospora fluostatini TaxID=1629071 RepID=A0ABY2DHD6_9ACTN|nr:hypothetical protein E1091_10470 [Micromonospora fluostatini]